MHILSTIIGCIVIFTILLDAFETIVLAPQNPAAIPPECIFLSAHLDSLAKNGYPH